VHKVANVLSALPKSAQPGARRALAEIRDAEDRAHAVAAADAFARDYGAKWPKAVAKIVDDLDPLLTFYDFPAEHWQHLKTTNPIESTFATVRLRTRVTKGPGSRAAGLAMTSSSSRPPRTGGGLHGPHLVALVRAGARFEKGVIIERRPVRPGSRRVINGTTRSTGLDYSRPPERGSVARAVRCCDGPGRASDGGHSAGGSGQPGDQRLVGPRPGKSPRAATRRGRRRRRSATSTVGAAMAGFSTTAKLPRLLHPRATLSTSLTQVRPPPT
jgi:hypothetical protein